DRPNVFYASPLWELPGRSLRDWTGALFGGWQPASIIRLESGPIVDVRDATASYPGVSYRFAKKLPGLNPTLPASQCTPERYFNSDAYSAPAANEFGDSFGRLHGVPTRSFDATLSKYFRIREGHRL